MSTPDEIGAHSASSRPPAANRPPFWRSPVILGSAAAVAAAAVVGFVLQANGDDEPGTSVATSVTYELQPADAMAMCLPVADIPVIEGADALAGVVTSIDGQEITIDVDRWYTDGTAAQVKLVGTDQSVALDGVDFKVGERFLVTAADGVVQPCGVSGPASSELEAIYENWYG